MNKRSAGKKHKRGSLTGDKIMVLLMMLPGLAYLIINNYMPMFGISIAFMDLDFSLKNVFASPWNNFENFTFLFESGEIMGYIKNTVLYNLAFLAVNLTLPVAFAILFMNIGNKTTKKLYQTLILLPNLMSWVIVSYITFGLFSGENGMINHLIVKFGGEPINFYGREALGAWPFIIVFFNTWKGIGFSFLFYYSACLAIDASFYEAAKLDGANFWQQVIHITLPGIKPIMITMFIMGLGGIVRSDYGLFYMLSQNSAQLYPVTQTLDMYIFNMVKGMGDFALSSAASVMQSIVGFILIVAANLVLKKVSPDDAMF